MTKIKLAHSQNIAIIGSGISGLYMAYRLLQVDKSVKITIYEKSNTIGGRIQTVYDKQLGTYEIGAYRFNKSHKSLLKLIKEFKLEYSPVCSQIDFYYCGKKTQYKMYDQLKIIIKASKQYDKKYLQNVPFGLFALSILTNQELDLFINSFGYDVDFQLQSAYNSIKDLNNDMQQNMQFYTLTDGMFQIINGLYKQIKSKCELLTNHEIIDYDGNNTITAKHKNRLMQKQFDLVIFCVAKQDLVLFPGLMQSDIKLRTSLDSIGDYPLNKIYAQFPPNQQGEFWFNNLQRTTTNQQLRYIIPINKQTGLILISYTDGQHSETWQSIKNKKVLRQLVMQQLRHIFPNLDIPQPIWIKNYYWKIGVHYFKPNYVPYKNNTKQKFLICGEMINNDRKAWIESSLQSVDCLFDD